MKSRNDKVKLEKSKDSISISKDVGPKRQLLARGETSEKPFSTATTSKSALTSFK